MIPVIDKVAATICLLIGLIVGIFLTHMFYAAEVADAKITISDLKKQHSDEIASTKAAALDRFQIATARSDALQSELYRAEQNLNNKESEVQREIQRNTSGRACLNQRTVSMLNNRTDERSTASGMPTPVSEPAADGGTVATDTDIATWANIVITQYSTCKARLDALIAWHLQSGDGKHD